MGRNWRSPRLGCSSLASRWGCIAPDGAEDGRGIDPAGDIVAAGDIVGPGTVRAAGLGLASAAYYSSSYYPYDYGYGYDNGYGYGDCIPVRQRVWDGYAYRVVWVNPCNYY